MTIKNLYPKSRPQIIYNVINGRPEAPGSSAFSRASIGTYVDSAGLLQTASADQPRFNYDPYTGEYLGLLLEEANLNAWPNGYMQTYSGKNNPNSDQDMGPLGTVNAAFLENDDPAEDGGYAYNGAGSYAEGVVVTISYYVKSPAGRPVVRNSTYAGSQAIDFLFVYRDSFANDPDATCTQVADDVWLIKQTVTGNKGTYQNAGFSRPRTGYTSSAARPMWFSGVQIEEGRARSSFIETNSGKTEGRAADLFSLTTSSNFDNGFSLLLDSDTTTEDFVYKIKASGIEIASLTNDGGTLVWDINGKSAQLNGEYPQVGFLSGRVRTVSSFGPADQGDQLNYLYTTGISFPTTAAPGAGADELELGVPQTLKALYLWNGQLGDTEAVSVIKGEYNVVPNEPILADSYSFVYNTDPNNEGINVASLDRIIPTVSMRVYWGDGQSSRYEQGVLPQHTYPYPGQYRIQIVADDGLDSATLWNGGQDNITRVDQWAPQHRVGATGSGFTGDDLFRILYYQKSCTYFPAFKYTDLTTLEGAWYLLTSLNDAPPQGTDWVPTDLPECTSLKAAFVNLAASGGDFTPFPQLKTSDKLVNLQQAFMGCDVSEWVDEDGNPTNKPFTNTANVTSFNTTFPSMGLSDIDVDTSSGTDFTNCWANNAFVTFPPLNFSSATVMAGAFANNKKMTTWDRRNLNDFQNVVVFTKAWSEAESLTVMPEIDIRSATNISEAWYNCKALKTFPALDYSSVITAAISWTGCTDLETFPPSKGSTSLDFPEATSLYYAWRGCNSLTSFPSVLNAPNCTDVSHAFYGCNSLTSIPSGADFNVGTDPSKTFVRFNQTFLSCDSLQMPEIDMTKCTEANSCFAYMQANTSFPPMDMPICTVFSQTWFNNSNLTAFPSIDISAGENYQSCWASCVSLADFPANMFDTTGTLIDQAFSNCFKACALTAQSIENILVSLDTNGATNQVLGIEGGTNAAKSTWTGAAVAAYDNLIAKGWTISFNA